MPHVPVDAEALRATMNAIEEALQETARGRCSGLSIEEWKAARCLALMALVIAETKDMSDEECQSRYATAEEVTRTMRKRNPHALVIPGKH